MALAAFAEINGRNAMSPDPDHIHTNDDRNEDVDGDIDESKQNSDDNLNILFKIAIPHWNKNGKSPNSGKNNNNEVGCFKK